MFGINTSLIIGLAAGLAGFAAGIGAGKFYQDRFVDAPVIAQLRIDLADQKTATANAETRYKTLSSQVLKDVADANIHALNAIHDQAAEAERLRVQLAKAQADRETSDRAMTAALNQAEMSGQSAPLSPAVLAWIASLHARQTGMAP